MEAVVVLGLITLLSTATLINFTGVNDALTLRKERFQAALAIREAQNMALAIRLLSGGVAAPAYGVNFSANSSTYFLLRIGITPGVMTVPLLPLIKKSVLTGLWKKG